jgi:hypothetical protein
LTELRPDAIIARGVWRVHGQSHRWVRQLQLCELGDFAEFLRMFDHYLFRGRVAAAAAGEKPPLGLVEDDSWSRGVRGGE